MSKFAGAYTGVTTGILQVVSNTVQVQYIPFNLPIALTIQTQYCDLYSLTGTIDLTTLATSSNGIIPSTLTSLVVNGTGTYNSQINGLTAVLQGRDTTFQITIRLRGYMTISTNKCGQKVITYPATVVLTTPEVLDEFLLSGTSQTILNQIY